MIDIIVMPILKCVLSLFIWTLLGGTIGLGVKYGIDGLNFRELVEYQMELEDWSWAIMIISLVGMFTIFMIILNLKL